MNGIIGLPQLALGIIFLLLAPLEGQSLSPFSHQKHKGLFPLCTGCHSGVETGDVSTQFPPPALCLNCHDGQQAKEVKWQGPGPQTTQLKFDHQTHVQRVAGKGGEALECSHCHTAANTSRMQVVRADVARCLDCHAHKATDHFAEAKCTDCHNPLAASGFTLERIERLPKPINHTAPDFLARGHGAQARDKPTLCSTCHTQETCTSCHVDPGFVATIAQIPTAPSGMVLPKREARYPTPASHNAPDFLKTHGWDLAPATCATCHTQESCMTCHAEEPPGIVAKLAREKVATAVGVVLQRQPPPSHEAPFFLQEHQGLAADKASCMACHAPSFCSDCHDQADRPSYHPVNFALRHSTQAFGRQLECATCHNTAAFCRECHAQLGQQARGRLDPSFHDKAPAWLLRHGQAARQELESCATCHQQTDCLQCHSQLGRFRVSPHGPDFDAQQVAAKNEQICLACHLRNPLERTNP